MANERARALRKSMTRQEIKLWAKLRELRSLGYHFRRQSPLLRYIVDFECRRSRLIVEVDGHQHGFETNQQRDAVRDRILARAGYKVMRFSNDQIDREMEGVLETVLLALSARSRPHPAASRPPSPKGEG
jgi:very-short-patch-repair endonuclease